MIKQLNAILAFSCALGLSLLSQTTTASPLLQSQIESLVKQHKGARFVDPVVILRKNNPDLSHCDIGTVETIPGATLKLGINTFSVICRGQKKYVSAIIDGMLRLPVLKRSLKRGDIVSEQDIEYRAFPKNHFRNGMITESSQLINMELKRPMANGTPLNSYHFSKPQIIKRGQTVDVLSRGLGFEIKRKGVALRNGSAGDQIGVRFDQYKVVDGIIMPDGSISLK